MTSDLLKNPRQYGIAPNTLIRLDGQPSPDHAAYLDLIDSRNQSWSNQGLAVIEDQGNALLYLLPADAPQCRQRGGLGDLINILACRGDARYVAVVHPGRLDFYPLRLQLAGEPHATYPNIATTSLHAFLTGALLTVGPKTKQQKADKRWLDTFLFKLLTGTADALRAAEPQLSHGQILSLVGRALFARFIADRGILLDSDAANVAGETSVQSLSQLFDSASTLAHTCAWLDKTFNGNLLEMDVPGAKDSNPSATQYEAFFKRCPKTHEVLRDVLNNAPEGQRQLGWQDIKFQHVPADMLSQVYEHFAHEFQAETAKKTSIHYTPRRIAQQLVNAAFAGSNLQTKSQAHVLDPTVGAGVFLVLAYKRLVRERWQETGKRPQRAELRSILNSQLCGLDINKESLKFAALSLYLTALELDPDPTPLSALKFDDLNGCVLRFVGAPEYEGLGSLHDRWAHHAELRNRFDLVVGNPPWTKPKNQKKLIFQYTQIVQACARRTGLFDDTEIKRLVSDSGKPDPVFVWRVLDWLKSDGMMALALHAQHMLFERGNGYELRKALLNRIELTGVLNGSALRQSPIWPSQAAPFCLWVARNRLPQENSSFYFLNPYEEASLVEREQYRLDMKDATVVQQNIAASAEYVFKTLSKGDSMVLKVCKK